MPKLKTCKSAQKRLRISKTGKIKHFKPYKSHLLTLKRAKRKRFLNRPGFVAKGEKKSLMKLLPYGA